MFCFNRRLLFLLSCFRNHGTELSITHLTDLDVLGHNLLSPVENLLPRVGQRASILFLVLAVVGHRRTGLFLFLDSSGVLQSNGLTS